MQPRELDRYTQDQATEQRAGIQAYKRRPVLRTQIERGRAFKNHKLDALFA